MQREGLVMADATAALPSKPSPLRLLSLDGGGIRGISELVILEEIMHRVQRTENLPSPALPADYFDFICGTSTGGLIALLLGRLRLSVPQAIEKYRILAEQVFSKKKAPGKDGTFKASTLEMAIRKVVLETFGVGHADEKMFVDDSKCKTFVCAVPAKHINKEPRLFRTWSADKNPGYNCTIWEAARATSAAPRFFKRIRIGDPGLQEEFVDAGLGCNNPVRFLVEEAQRECGSMREVSCIVSIGTGKPKVAGFKAPGLFQRALPLDLINILKSMATDSEDEAKRMANRYQNCGGLYHRLNVDRGLEEVSLEEWEKLGDVKTHTMAYLRDISNDIDLIVAALVRRSTLAYRLGQLGGAIPGPSQLSYHFVYPSSRRVNHFVPRMGPEEEIQRYFEASQNNAEPTIVVLLGMGGCGKSQLALEYCQQSELEKSFSVIFWIDASSLKSVNKSFNSLARELSKPGFDVKDVEQNCQFVLTKLRTWQGRWLLVFDNFDDLPSFESKSIKEYFPRGKFGFILITSRDRAAGELGSAIDISTMSNDEALMLLFRRSEVTKTVTTLPEAGKIVKRLGFHALAIDQAGAYIRARTLDLDLFLEHYDKRMKQVLDETPGIWDYTRKPKNQSHTETKLTVFTTWELSYDMITGYGTTLEDKKHILTLFAFFDRNDISDTLFKPYSFRNGSWMTSCKKESAWDEYTFQDILKELRNLSLVQTLRIQRSGASLSLHPLVRDWMKLRISSESRRAYTIEASLVLSDFLETTEFHEMSFHSRQSTSSHLEAIIQDHKEYLNPHDDLQSPAMLDAIHVFAAFSTSLGREIVTEELLRRELQGRKSLFGTEHLTTIICMNSLAISLLNRSERIEAETMFREALALIEKVSGKDHPDTLIIIGNLASLLDSENKHEEAETLYRQALASQEKILGKEHPSTVVTIGNLAVVLDSEGKNDEAEILYRQAITSLQKLLGKEHPNTLISLSNLALFFESQGKYGEAEQLYRQVLVVREKSLGKAHPDTVLMINKLAGVLCSQGRDKEAAELLVEYSKQA